MTDSEFEYDSDREMFIFEGKGKQGRKTRSSKLKKLPPDHEMYQKAEFTTEILVNTVPNTEPSTKPNTKPNANIEKIDETSFKLYKKITKKLKFMLIVYEAVDFNEDPAKFGKVLFSCVEYMKVELKMYSREVFLTYISSFIDSFTAKIEQLCNCFECCLKNDSYVLKSNLRMFFEDEMKSEIDFFKPETTTKAATETSNYSVPSSQQTVNLINSLNLMTKPGDNLDLDEIFEHLVVLSVLSDESFIQNLDSLKLSVVGLFLVEIDSQLEWDFSNQVIMQKLAKMLCLESLKMDISSLPDCFTAGHEYLESLKYFTEFSDRHCLTDHGGKGVFDKFKGIFERVLQFSDGAA